jgi:hypothetical protein
MNLQRHLQDIANLRRLELMPLLFQYTGGRVQTGPFAGMTIVPRTCWGDGDTPAKLLGVYENELHEFVDHAVKAKPDYLLNIGCAEGYYIVGLCRLLPHVTADAVDISPTAIEICHENSLANNVTGLNTTRDEITCEWIEDKCHLPKKPLLIVDCEGAELTLLDPVKVPSLSKCSILVECHDCAIPGITDTLTQRFEETHTVQLMSQTTKDPYQFDFLKDLSDCDKWALVHEGRPSTMTWLYITPKL